MAASEERRGEIRYTRLLRVGLLETDDGKELCLVRNISASGAMVRVYSPKAVGARARLELKSEWFVGGTVAWSKASDIGIRFDEPIDVHSVLQGEPNSGHRPRLPRLELLCPVALRMGSKLYRATLRDISQGGIKATTEERLPEAEVVVSIAGFHPIHGRVRWSSNGHAGIAFNELLPLRDLTGWLNERQQHAASTGATEAANMLSAEQAPDDGLYSSAATRQGVRAILDSIPQVIWCADSNGGLDFLSRQWRQYSGSLNELTLGGQWIESVHPDDRARAWEAWHHSVRSGEDYEIQFRVRHHSGTHRWNLVRALPERDRHGRIARWYGTCTDVHEQVLAREALAASEALNRSIIEASPDAITMLDLDGKVLFLNPAALRDLAAQPLEGSTEQSWLDQFTPDFRTAALEALSTAREGSLARFSALRTASAGPAKWWDVVLSPVLDHECRPIHLIALARDVTQQKAAENQAQWSADHDPLTKLPNRARFQRRLDELIAAGAGPEHSFALLLLDFDDFKQINDTLGHQAGDTLLCSFADRLRSAIGAGDLVARLGGDEFGVILAGAVTEREVAASVAGMIDKLHQPCVYEGRLLDGQASIGASIYPAHGTSTAELLKHADIALYAAKASGRGKLRLFEPAMRAEMQKHVSMLALARGALDEDRICPFYQPKVDLRTGGISGFEALLRWRHPRKGMQLPDTIEAAFQDMNLAAEVSDRMVAQVITDVRRWLDRGVDFDHVAINCAAAEFRRGDFAERLLKQLSAAGIPPNRLQIEVTETVFLGRGAEYVERALKLLSEAGMQIALDDFGTGYASLSHLKQFPVDVIKIDRSFVRDLDEDPDDEAIVRAVINLGKSLDIKIVAEGIESWRHARYLRDAGCDFGQGFLFAKAVRAGDISRLLTGEVEKNRLTRLARPRNITLATTRNL